MQEHWNIERYKQYKRKQRSKYGAKKTETDGYKFDSIAERRRYEQLRLLQELGCITELKLQPHYLLQEHFRKNGKTYKKIEYIADFQYIENGKTIIEDVKGLETEVFKIKRKMFEYKYPELELKIVKEV